MVSEINCEEKTRNTSMLCKRTFENMQLKTNPNLVPSPQRAYRDNRAFSELGAERNRASSRSADVTIDRAYDDCARG